MRKVRYNCATSLDGYITGPGDEFDWIVISTSMNYLSNSTPTCSAVERSR